MTLCSTLEFCRFCHVAFHLCKHFFVQHFQSVSLHSLHCVPLPTRRLSCRCHDPRFPNKSMDNHMNTVLIDFQQLVIFL